MKVDYNTSSPDDGATWTRPRSTGWNRRFGGSGPPGSSPFPTVRMSVRLSISQRVERKKRVLDSEKGLGFVHEWAGNDFQRRRALCVDAWGMWVWVRGEPRVKRRYFGGKVKRWNAPAREKKGTGAFRSNGCLCGRGGFWRKMEMLNFKSRFLYWRHTLFVSPNCFVIERIKNGIYENFWKLLWCFEVLKWLFEIFTNDFCLIVSKCLSLLNTCSYSY